MVFVSIRTSRSPGLTSVPLSMMNTIVLLAPRTRQRISTLLALSSVPSSVTLTFRSWRAMVDVSLGAAFRGDLPAARNPAAAASTARTASEIEPRTNQRRKPDSRAGSGISWQGVSAGKAVDIAASLQGETQRGGSRREGLAAHSRPAAGASIPPPAHTGQPEAAAKGTLDTIGYKRIHQRHRRAAPHGLECSLFWRLVPQNPHERQCHDGTPQSTGPA